MFLSRVASGFWTKKTGGTLTRLYYSSQARLSMLSDKYTVLADDGDIEKPKLDDRRYRLIKLNSNDLHALVIHDGSVDKSAASLDVNVGSFADKEYEISGLAHFCEHLLFMGTNKYPEENEYSSYLAKHSGYSNAYTAAEHTNYYFELGSDYLEGALDRFAQFFIGPLFSKACKDREIKAVDSENKKNLQNDMWRFYQLDKLTSNEHHPYNGFSTGNFETLHNEPVSRDLNVRDVLIDFYKSHYSSNIMSLVILGKEDLDTLSTWAIEKFSDVPTKNLDRPNYKGELIYNREQMGTLLKAKPIMDTHKLELTFLVPDDQEDKWQTKPSGYYSHLLGHESSGSILYYLKQKCWVNELSAGSVKVCQGNSVFVLEFELTPQGLQNWEKIVEYVFSYLRLILSEEPQSWLWEELRSMSLINFKFKQKQRAANTVSKLSNTLYKFGDNSFIPSKHVLSSSVLRKFDKDEIKKYGSHLNPDNFRIFLSSQSLTGLDKREKWYGTEYSYERIPDALMRNLKVVDLNENFHIPLPNKFIPEDFIVSNPKAEKPLPHPYLLEDNNKFQIWYKQDDQFEIPKGAIVMLLHLPKSSVDIKSSVYTSILSELIDDELNEYVYYASQAGLSFTIDHWRDGLMIKLNGFNDKLSVLLEQILTSLHNFIPREDRFDVTKFKISQELKNAGYEVPYAQIGTHFLTLINDKVHSFQDKLKFISNGANFQEFQEFSTTLLKESGVFGEVLIQGNFTHKKAVEVSEVVQKSFKKFGEVASSPEQTREVVKPRSHYLPKAKDVRYDLFLEDKDNINSCIEYFIQIDDTLNDVHLRVLTDLLGTIISEPCFNQLRTKEQLGYVVFSGTRLTRTTLGFRILVQSEKSTQYLEYRIVEFLNKFGQFVNHKLTDDNFAKFKRALKDKKLTKLKNLSEEVNLFWNSIVDGYYDFQSKEVHVKILESISKQDFINFFNKYIIPDSQEASRIVVHLKSQKVPELTGAKLIHCSVNNFVYRYDYTVSSDVLDKIIEAHFTDIPRLAKEVANAIAQSKLNNVQDIQSLQKKLQNTLQTDSTGIVPPMFPRGKLYEKIEDFKSDFAISAIPQPVAPLSSFYYPKSTTDHVHL